MMQPINKASSPISKMVKKASKKTTTQIPLDALGFRSKVFYDSTYEYVPRKKYNKFSKYQKQRKRQNFRARLTCVIDPSHATHQQIGDMKFTKRYEWKAIKYVIYRTKQEPYCCICLGEKFTAPQMTFCGHVFCWHCIMMHYQKSLKASSCPVCNQIFQPSQLKTCQTLYLPPLAQGDKIRLKLKTRSLNYQSIFNPQTLQEEYKLSHIIRMKNSKSLQKFKEEHDEIINQMKRDQDPQVQKYLAKVLQFSQKKIDDITSTIGENSPHYKPHKHEKVTSDGIVCRILPSDQLQKEKDKLLMFYQEEQGRYVFLHPICQKYLRKNYQADYLPLTIEETIILKEETQFSTTNLKRYKYLNHLPQNQQFQFVFISLNELIDYKLYEEFQKEFEQYKKKKQEIIAREEELARKLNEKYQQDQEYLRKLKKMEESEFYDISVPVNMIDFSEIQDDSIFPSLVSTPSENQNSKDQQNNDSQLSQKSSPVDFGFGKKKKNKNFVLKQEEFPGLELAVKLSLGEPATQQIKIDPKIQQDQYKRSVSQTLEFPKMGQQNQINKGKKQKIESQDTQVKYKGKGKKKKKQKFIDVTHQFFQRPTDEQY